MGEGVPSGRDSGVSSSLDTLMSTASTPASLGEGVREQSFFRNVIRLKYKRSGYLVFGSSPVSQAKLIFHNFPLLSSPAIFQFHVLIAVIFPFCQIELNTEIFLLPRALSH